MNQFWSFYVIFLNNFKYFFEAYSLSKICKIVLEYTLKCSQLSCWQPKMSGWIQATLQQNTFTVFLFKIFSSQVFLFGNLIHNDVIKVATALKLPKQLAWQTEGKTWGNNFYCSFFFLPQTGWPKYSHTISKEQQ